MGPLAPARRAGHLGTYWTTEIGTQEVVLFKSDSQMSRDGTHIPMPNETLWKQTISDCQPELVITTGTGGGIGPIERVGDVIVSRYVTFDCQGQFRQLNGLSYASAGRVLSRRFPTAKSLFKPNAQFLPPDDHGALPRIVQARGYHSGIVTTDFFGFDTSDNHYGLQGLGALSEMGDAVLGKASAELAQPPAWVIVRNVSDPQIAAQGTLAEQKAMAGKIYKAYGRWSSVCSAIVCWAITAAR